MDAKKLEETVDKLKSIFLDMFGVKLVSTDKMDPPGSDSLDSLDQIELVMEIEEQFEIEIPDSTFDDGAWKDWTVEDVAKKIMERTNA